MKFKGSRHPVIISPTRVSELYDITHTPQGEPSLAPTPHCQPSSSRAETFKLDLHSPVSDRAGVWVGAGCTLSAVKALLEKLVLELPLEQLETFSALVQQLGHLGGWQIRNVAVSVSWHPGRERGEGLFHYCFQEV